MDKKLAKNIFFSVICSLLMLGGVLAAVFTISPNNDTSAFNSTYTETDNSVVVDEIWDGSNFNKANTQTLLNMLCNSNSGNIDTLSSNIGSGTINATTLRGYSNGGNAEGKSIVVTLGGFKWIVTYLFKDSDGNTCATLWMADANGKSTYCDSSRYYGADNWVSGYPASMYGISYVSTVTLNNGGEYLMCTTNSANPTSINGNSISSSTHEYASPLYCTT